MNACGAAIAASILLAGSSAQLARAEPQRDFPMTMRPGTLADLVDTLAGGSVRLVNARVVGVFDPQVFLVESQTRLRPVIDRNRVLVFVETGSVRVEPARLVAATVTVSGVARTLLGMQTADEVKWPTALTREAVERLDIRAAVLATSVRTPEGIDLLVPSSSRLTPSPPPAASARRVIVPARSATVR